MAEEIKKEKSGKRAPGGDIFIVRIIVCVVILIGTLLLRFNNQYIYDSLKFWYEENILEEKYSFKTIISSAQTSCLPLKNKILDLFSGISSFNLANK